MNATKCKCGESLITHDEKAREACWECQGLAWRLNLLDRELKMIESASRRAWEYGPALHLAHPARP